MDKKSLAQVAGIAGSGGGGGGKGKGGSRSPVETADNLISKDYARVVAVLSEGPIQGFADLDPTKSIRLDNTPLRNPDGYDNFQNYQIDYRYGYPGQAKLAGSAAQATTFNIGTKVTTTAPVTHTITDADVDAVRFTIATPAFKNINTENGDILPSYVAFDAYLSSGGGPYVRIAGLEFNGKSAGNYSQDYEWGLSGSAPWSLQIRRLTPDSTSDKVANDIFFQRATEIKYNSITYDNRAVMFAGFPADYFQNVPTITALCNGLIIKTPHNYNAATRAYVGTFNGTLINQFTNNPAWVMYDLCVNDRYGIGIPAANLDVYSFYALAQYCDQLVPDGLGGYQPRYTYNNYIKNKSKAWDILQSVASACRTKIYFAGGTVRVVVDKPRTFSKIYSRSNTLLKSETDSNFKYQTTPLDSRYTVVNVTWFDPASSYKPKTDTVKDTALIASIGYNSTDITAAGATSRAQAIRYARWLIYTTCYQTKSVEFSIAAEGLDVEPGEVCRIQDPTMNGTNSYGGRLKGTGASAVLDRQVTFAGGTTYTLSIEGSGGLASYTYTPATTVTSDTIPVAITEEVNSPWLLTFPGSGQDFQILNITEDDGTYTISALEYSADKWARIETFTQSNLENSLFSGYTIPPAPANITVTESLYATASNQQVGVKLTLLWSAATTAVGIAGYDVSYRRIKDSTWTLVPPTNFLTLDVMNAAQDTYVFRLSTLGKGGTSSPYVYYTYNVIGLSAKPSNLSTFRINSDRGDNVELGWAAIQDLDVLIGGGVEIRHTSLTSGATWIDGTIIGYVAGTQTSAIVPKAFGTYMAKAVDSSGNYCLIEATETTSLLTLAQLNVVNTVSNSTTFAGVKNSVRYDGSTIFLSYDDQMDSDTDPMNNDTDIMNKSGSNVVLVNGYYYLTTPIDVGGVYTCNITTTLVSNSFSTSDIMNNDIEIMNSNDPLTAPSDGANCISEIAVSQDGTTFSSWRPFYTGSLLGKVFKFRLRLFSVDTTANVAVSQYAVTIDMPDRTESSTVTTSALGDSTITFTNAFKAAPVVAASIQNETTTGERVAITGITPSGFTLATYNSGGARIARTVAVSARGYGYSV